MFAGSLEFLGLPKRVDSLWASSWAIGRDSVNAAGMVSAVLLDGAVMASSPPVFDGVVMDSGPCDQQLHPTWQYLISFPAPRCRLACAAWQQGDMMKGTGVCSSGGWPAAFAWSGGLQELVTESFEVAGRATSHLGGVWRRRGAFRERRAARLHTHARTRQHA
eukprot:365457-Chlamydomonas_euryale.AAC.10